MRPKAKAHIYSVERRLTVRPGAAGLLIGIEYSRVWDSSWMYLTSFVTTPIGVELAAVQRKLPNRAVVGLQLYSVKASMPLILVLVINDNGLWINDFI